MATYDVRLLLSLHVLSVIVICVVRNAVKSGDCTFNHSRSPLESAARTWMQGTCATLNNLWKT